MAEIVSAEDFVTALFIKWAELKYEEIEAEAVARVRSRDKAIVERIKAVIMADTEPYTMIRQSHVIELIDDVLRDLGIE